MEGFRRCREAVYDIHKLFDITSEPKLGRGLISEIKQNLVRK